MGQVRQEAEQEMPKKIIWPRSQASEKGALAWEQEPSAHFGGGPVEPHATPQCEQEPPAVVEVEMPSQMEAMMKGFGCGDSAHPPFPEALHIAPRKARGSYIKAAGGQLYWINHEDPMDVQRLPGNVEEEQGHTGARAGIIRRSGEEVEE